MFKSFTLLCAGLTLSVCDAQFYPSGSAGWCSVWNAPGEPVQLVRYEMFNGVDTLIDGLVYSILFDANPNDDHFWRERYYIRNGDDGKGYLRYPGSPQEYLTGDLGAAEGDTVQDVLILDFSFIPLCSEQDTVKLVPFVVDSIVDLISFGVEYRRHYVHSPCIDFGFPNSNPLYYWQSGMGTEFGPCMVWSVLPVYIPITVVVNDTVVGGFKPPVGTPSGGACAIGLEVQDMVEEPGLRVYPNPATDRLVVSTPPSLIPFSGQLHLYNVTGQLVMSSTVTTSETQLNVAHLEGLYTLVLGYGAQRWVQRVVIY